MLLADALVVRHERDAHFNEEAASLLKGIILFVGLHAAPERQHLGTDREIIDYDIARFEEVLKLMQEIGGIIGRTADRFLGKAEREAASVRSTAQRHTDFLDSPRMARFFCGKSTFTFEEQKKKHVVSISPCRLIGWMGIQDGCGS